MEARSGPGKGESNTLPALFLVSSTPLSHTTTTHPPTPQLLNNLTFASSPSKAAPPVPPTDDAAATVARFLHTTLGLPPSAVGAIIAAPAAASVLAAYTAGFDWGAEASFDAALRRFLAAARLPGEPAAADRVLAAWATAWYDATAQQDGKAEVGSPATRHHPSFANADAAHVLAFSAVLLNTDAHSAAVKAKMTLPQFAANLAGANGGSDFEGGLLEALYESVLARPMLVPGGADAGDATGSLSRAASASGLKQRLSQGGGARRRRWWQCWAGR